MEICKEARAGTLESSDVLVLVAPSPDALRIDVQSVVEKQFGRAILALAQEVCAALGVAKGIVRLNDKGALDCTLRARLETALERAAKL